MKVQALQLLYAYLETSLDSMDHDSLRTLVSNIGQALLPHNKKLLDLFNPIISILGRHPNVFQVLDTLLNEEQSTSSTND
jgi:hypothetical protein